MAFKLNDAVLVTRKVFYRDDNGDAQVIDLSSESGTVKKVDSGYYYVETQYGVHYLKESDMVSTP